MSMHVYMCALCAVRPNSVEFKKQMIEVGGAINVFFVGFYTSAFYIIFRLFILIEIYPHYYILFARFHHCCYCT